MDIVKKRIFEYTEGSSNKFWEISLCVGNCWGEGGYSRGYSIQVRWGSKNGNSKWLEKGGQTKLLANSTLSLAVAEIDFTTKIRSKLDKGYKEVGIKEEKLETNEPQTIEDASLSRFSMIMDDL